MTREPKNGQEKRARAREARRSRLDASRPKRGGPPVFQLINGAQMDDAFFSRLCRLSHIEDASPLRSSASKPKSDSSKNSAGPKKTPWPLEVLITREKGMLALRVKPGAGIERYGQFDGDILLIGVEDEIESGSPALAVLDDNTVAGWYRPRRGGQIAIVPFVSGASPVVAVEESFQVLFELQAIACPFPARLGLKSRAAHSIGGR